MTIVVRTVLCGSIALAAIGAAGTARAAIFGQRDTTYLLTGTNDLANVVTRYDNNITLPAGGESSDQLINLRTGAYDVYFATSGGVTTSATVPPPGTASFTASITNDGSGGSFIFGYTTATGPSFAESWTQYGVAGNYQVLDFSGGGFGFLDVGGVYNLSVTIAGDWSTPGFTSGGHVLAALNPDYAVTSNFVYDSILDQTIFSATSTTFQGNPPGLRFYLVGAAVPEPQSWMLMIGGFCLAGVALRRYRAVAAA